MIMKEIKVGDLVKVKKGVHWQEHDWSGRKCRVSEIKHNEDTGTTIYIAWYNPSRDAQGRGVFFESELELVK